MPERAQRQRRRPRQDQQGRQEQAQGRERGRGAAHSSRPVCARCLEVKGLVCCQAAPGEKLATLLLADLERIEAATGLSRARFCEREELDPMERLAYETARPVYRGVFAGNVRFGLKAKKGDCVFLEPGRGCALPRDARPLACRLYPFDFDLSGALTLVEAPQCLALEEAGGPAHLLRLLGTSRRGLRRLRAQMLAEGADHARRIVRPHRAPF